MSIRVVVAMCVLALSAGILPGGVVAEDREITREQAEQFAREVLEAAERAEAEYGEGVQFDGMRVDSVDPDRLEANDVHGADVDVDADVDPADEFDFDH